MKIMRIAAGLAAALLVAAVPSAWAADAAKPSLKVTIDNFANFDSAGGIVSHHELDFLLKGNAGNWTISAEAFAGLSQDWKAGLTSEETPTLELVASSDKFGTISALDTDTALDNVCITPTPGSTHFGTEDLMGFSTCAGYGGQAVRYITPDFFDGFGLQVSAMRDLKGLTAPGDVDSGLSAALTYKHADNGVTYSADLAVDAATSVNGGLPAGTALPVTVQGGGKAEWDGWTIATAAQYEFASLGGGNRWSAGAGVSRAVTETLTIGTEAAVDSYQSKGVKIQELSLGTTGEYKFASNASVDAAFNVVRRMGDDGSDEMVEQVGTGLSVWF